MNKNQRLIPAGSRKTLEMVRCAACQCEVLVRPAEMQMNLFGNKVWEHTCPLSEAGYAHTPAWRSYMALIEEGWGPEADAFAKANGLPLLEAGS